MASNKKSGLATWQLQLAGLLTAGAIGFTMGRYLEKHAKTTHKATPTDAPKHLSTDKVPPAPPRHNRTNNKTKTRKKIPRKGSYYLVIPQLGDTPPKPKTDYPLTKDIPPSSKIFSEKKNTT